MKSILCLILSLCFYSCSLLAQKTDGKTLQFIASQKFYKIDLSGKVLVGPIELNGRVPNLNKSILYKEEYQNIYEIEGIEKLFNQKSDTLYDLLTNPQIMASVKRNGRFGVIDMNGQLLLPAIYESLSIYSFMNDEAPPLFQVEMEGKFGLANMNGALILPIEYDKLKQDWPRFIMASKDMKIAVLNHKGSKLTELIYDEMGSFRDGKCWFKKNELYGFIDESGKEVIPARFKTQPEYFYMNVCEIYEYPEGSYNKLIGLIDTTGNVIVNPIYDGISKYDRCFVVNKEQKYGLTGGNGKELLPLIYNEIVVIEGKDCFIKATDQKVHFFQLKNNILKPIAKIPEEKGNEWTIEYDDDKYGIKDNTGKLVVPYKHYKITSMDSTYYISVDKDLFTINSYGAQTKAAGPYQQACFIPGHRTFLVQKNNKWGMVQQNGKVLIPQEYEKLVPYDKELIKVMLTETLYHFLCMDMDLLYKDSLHYKNGLPNRCYYATKNGKTGLIDHDCKEIIPIMYNDMNRFYANTSLVNIDGKYKLIDIQNHEVYPNTAAAPDTMYKLFPEMYLVKYKQKYGMVSPNGKEVFAHEYDSIKGPVEPSDPQMYYGFNVNGCTIADSLGNITARNSKIKPQNSTEHFGFVTVYGMLTSITDSTGKEIWHEPIIYYKVENAGHIENELCQLKDLEEVSFVGNDSDDNFKLPVCFYDLKSMRKIKILNSSYDSIPDAIIHFKNLHYLETNSFLTYISPKIAELKNLDTLILENNKQLPEGLAQLKKLIYVSTQDPKIPAITSLKALKLYSSMVPDNFSQLTSLREFTFNMSTSHNENGEEIYLNSDSLLSISIKKITQAPSLESLELSGSGFDWVKALVENAISINAMTDFKSLHISYLGDDEKVLLEKVFPKLKIIRSEW